MAARSSPGLSGRPRRLSAAQLAVAREYGFASWPALHAEVERRLAEHVTCLLGFRWYSFPMEAVIDQAGRIVLPKAIRDALGLLPGTKVDISPYGAGVQLVPAGRTARLIEEDGVLVSAGETPVDDDMLFALIDAGRK
jgi:AbrB family looped-hinge helix DNA binding protein